MYLNYAVLRIYNLHFLLSETFETFFIKLWVFFQKSVHNAYRWE